MLTFEQMLLRLAVALLLGAILGVERELVGKEAGVRTDMLVAGGASIFTMIGLTLPYITSATLGTMPDASSVNAGLAIIANIVVGIGFLGAGLIIKTNDHPHGVTTAALVWVAAAIGILVGIGLTTFAVVAALLVAILLYILRKLNVSERLEKKEIES
jgi:putative Mg2+ transporter-C (MgtC) family protein